MFLLLHERLPFVHTSYTLPSSPQRNPADSGLSIDRCLKTTNDSAIYKDKGNMPVVSTTSLQSFNEMQQESRKLSRSTTWLRVVHRGYGPVAWRSELQKLNLTIVHGPFASEGDYVRIPEGLSAHEIVDVLTECNLKVRKIVWFRDMKRANKSRVLLKWAPFCVFPIGSDLPKMVETQAFSYKDE
jgi:hypothetical protein